MCIDISPSSRREEGVWKVNRHFYNYVYEPYLFSSPPFLPTGRKGGVGGGLEGNGWKGRRPVADAACGEAKSPPSNFGAIAKV